MRHTMGRTRRPVVIDSGTIGPPRGRMLLQRAQADCTRPRYSAPCLPIERNADTVLICDGGEFAQWGQSMLPVRRRLVNGVAGAIGASLSFALSARLLEPEAPVFAVLGDGTIGFHLAEFETAVRRRLPFVAVLGNDARWTAETQIQRRDYGGERMHGCELLPCRYDQVVTALGGHGELVDNA